MTQKFIRLTGISFYAIGLGLFLPAPAAALSPLTTEPWVRGGLATKTGPADVALMIAEAAAGYATAEQGDKADAALPAAGGAMTGALTLAANPVENMHAATKQYVDSQVGNILSALNAINGD
jgi:hypothetical protein